MTGKKRRRTRRIKDTPNKSSEHGQLDDATVQPTGRGTSEGISPTGRGTSEGISPTGRGTSEGISPTGRGTSE